MRKWVGYLLPVLSVVLILCFSAPVCAKSLGVMGSVYPIEEEDLLEWIGKRLAGLTQSGEMALLQQQFKEKAMAYVNRPTPMSGITRATVARTFYYDPSIKIEEDKVDHEGHVFQKAGTVINPLVYRSLPHPLLFLDADDPEQVKWAIKRDQAFKGRDNIILIQGDVVYQTALWKKVIYFDQGGHLVKKFRIQHVPALVTQEGLLLKIQEIDLHSTE